MMIDKIRQYLHEIEQEKNIKILWACETGSRAWGFASTDSDYDIRLVYVHRSDWYLSLTESKDSIERMLENNDIDISGWDLRKSLRLLNKSNASFLERIQSPIAYISDDEFIDELRSVAAGSYSRIATMHHYLSMSKKFIDELEQEEKFKLKKFFYCLRSAVVCKWIIEKEEMPHIEFKKVYSNLSIDEKLVGRIEELIKLKATIKESYYHSGEPELLQLIKQYIAEAEEVKHSLPAAKSDFQALDDLFKKYISKYDN